MNFETSFDVIDTTLDFAYSHRIIDVFVVANLIGGYGLVMGSMTSNLFRFASSS